METECQDVRAEESDFKEGTPKSEDRKDYGVAEQTADETIVEHEQVADEAVGVAEAPSAATDAVLTAAGGIVVKKSFFAIAGVLIAALTVGSLFLGMWIYHLKSTDPDGIDPGAKDYHSIYANAEHAGDDEITVPGYTDVFFPAGEKKVQIVLLNPDGNPCYFRFSLILSETDEELYRSGLIPPGMAVTDIELNRALEAGEYALRIRIESFSLSDRSEMNGADMETKLTVSR